MRRWSIALFGGAVLSLSGCSAGAPGGGAQTQAVSADEVRSLVRPEPDAPASQYVRTTAHVRLFGAQPGDGQNGFITLADTRTWKTDNLRMGDTIARNWMVSAIGPDYAELRSNTQGTVHLQVGAEVDLQEVVHVFDQATVSLGRLQYQVSSGTMANIQSKYGTGAAGAMVDIFQQSALQLSSVDPSGVLGRLGLLPQDLVFTLDGQPVGPQDLGALVQRFTTPQASAVHLLVLRNGNLLDLAFNVQ